MKYVLLIHSNPQPWGHPTSDFLPEYQAIPAEERQQSNDEWEGLLRELSANGELVGGEALGDPAHAKLLRRTSGGAHVVTDGPYSEAKEHLAGFFLLEVASAERAEEIARGFSGPGETVELRAVM